MKLSNAALLSIVWGLAVTGLALTAASIASADIMRATFNELPDEHGTVSKLDGRLGVIYDPQFQEVARADVFWHFESSNSGMFSIDSFESGWIDPFTEEFDVTLGTLSGFVIGPFPHHTWLFGPNGSFRLWHYQDPDSGVWDSGFTRFDDAGGVIETGPADIKSVSFTVPEPSSLALVALGLFGVALAARKAVARG